MDFGSAVLTLEFPEMIIGTVLLRGLIERAALRQENIIGICVPVVIIQIRAPDRASRDRRVELNVNLITLANRDPRYSFEGGAHRRARWKASVT